MVELFHYILWLTSRQTHCGSEAVVSRLIQHKRSDSFSCLSCKTVGTHCSVQTMHIWGICATQQKEGRLEASLRTMFVPHDKLSRNSISSEEYSKARMLNNICDFLSISRSIKVCSVIFGTCLFADSSRVIWKSQRISRVYGVFLYKHHLVLSEVGHMWSSNLKVRFVIPLKGLYLS